MLKLYFIDVRKIKNIDALSKIIPDYGLWAIRKKQLNSIDHHYEKLLALASNLGLIKLFEKNGISLLDLSISDKGKLYIDDQIHFNIAHDYPFVVFSIGAKENGIDIEKSDVDLSVLVDRFFTQEERTLLEKNQISFARLWTIKEAYLKAIGEGLIQPLDSFSVYNKGDSWAIKESPIKVFEFEKEGFTISLCGYEEAEKLIEEIKV